MRCCTSYWHLLHLPHHSRSTAQIESKLHETIVQIQSYKITTLLRTRVEYEAIRLLGLQYDLQFQPDKCTVAKRRIAQKRGTIEGGHLLESVYILVRINRLSLPRSTHLQIHAYFTEIAHKSQGAQTNCALIRGQTLATMLTRITHTLIGRAVLYSRRDSSLTLVTPKGFAWLLTYIESIDNIAEGMLRELVIMLVGHKATYAAGKALGKR